jgi:hypothetical protein
MDFSTENHEPKWLLIFKGLIRPVIVLATFLSLLYMVFHIEKFDKESLKYMFKITWTVIIIWFIERASRNTGLADLLVKLTRIFFNKKDKGGTELLGVADRLNKLDIKEK